MNEALLSRVRGQPASSPCSHSWISPVFPAPRFPPDSPVARLRVMSQHASTSPHRIGLGTDRHRLEPGLPLVLAGVTIPSEIGAVGHSDADVVFHSLADALLGAVGEGDIGELFPDTDPRYQGLDSRRIVEEALRRVQLRGFQAENVDIVIELERPKLLPHRPAMRTSIVALLGVEESCVGVKAKTGEGLGPVGEGKMIAATAVVLLVGVLAVGEENTK